MDDDLRRRILLESERFGFPVRCSQESVEVRVGKCSAYSVSGQFPLVAYLQEHDVFLSSPESFDSLCAFRRLYELFSQSCASRVEGFAGSARVSLYRVGDGVHIKYKLRDSED